MTFEREHGGPAALPFGESGDGVIPAIVLSELLAGSELAADSRQRTAILRFVADVRSKYSILPFGIPEAEERARLYAALRARGQMIGEADLQIAATAIANGHAVWTGNVREFERVPGLTVIPFPGGADAPG